MTQNDKASEREAKFRVGQVVVVRDRYIRAGELRRIVEVLYNPIRYLTSVQGFIAMECALRPLTKRERGK